MPFLWGEGGYWSLGKLLINKPITLCSQVPGSRFGPCPLPALPTHESQGGWARLPRHSHQPGSYPGQLAQKAMFHSFQAKINSLSYFWWLISWNYMESWGGLEEQYLWKILWLTAPEVLSLKRASLHQAQQTRAWSLTVTATLWI